MAKSICRRGILGTFLLLLLLAAAVPGKAQATPSTSTSPTTAPPTTATSLVLKGQVKKDYEALKAKAEAVQAEIDRLDLEIANLNEDYSELEIRLEELNGSLVELRRELKTAQDNYLYREEQVNQRLAALYKAGDDNVLEVLLASRNFTDFLKRAVLLYQLAERDQDLAFKFHNSADEMDAVQVSVEAKKSEGLQLKEAMEHKRLKIEERLAEREAALTNLDEKIKAFLEEERKRQEEEQRRLEEELRQRLAREQEELRQRLARQTYSGPLPESADEVLNQVVETAAAYLGIPYKWGGKRPSTGLDCSGLTKWVFEQHGVTLRHWSRHQSQDGWPVALKDIRTGDLVAFGSPVHHVGIYVGDDRFIHAPRTGDVVKISQLSKRTDLSAIRRFPLQGRAGPIRWG